ncbi:DNA annealing helicase and endonuclease ZRANB3 [Panicum miliaceum]|uniref:DNA annealing helicase and endonuclease ZRANB3 n=1 Tax=Panicum miliaceum TaxID=4540 RepID=A0A3L6TGM8_PANMI|nr:DNA annealing helicase and endonuclease ZRANB3 [Panicum miliaceum]
MAGLDGGGGGGWGGYYDNDDWGLSAEQLDQIERDAIRQLAERKASSSAASTAPVTAPALGAVSPLPSRATAPAAAASSPLGGNHPAARVSLEARFGKHQCNGSVTHYGQFFWDARSFGVERINVLAGVNLLVVEAVSPSRSCDSNTSRNAVLLKSTHLFFSLVIQVNNSQGSSPKISVNLFLHSSRVIAAKFPYNQLLVDAFRKIPKASWNAKERVWMFPPSSLSTAEEVLRSVPGLAVECTSLAGSQIGSASSACFICGFKHQRSSRRDVLQAADLIFLGEDLYDRIPTDVESKLMPFQREGIRFVLQHGGRALIADEMGLGKTLQTIQNWLNIPMEDILADCKFLIFAHHQSLIDAIEHLMKKKVLCIRIDGQTPVTTRQTLVTYFQNKDDIKAAVLSIKSGGYGLTLTAASTVIFAELSWTPGDIIQAEDRAHRIGQVSSVNVYYLLSHGTIDDLIWGAVQGKLENLGQMLDGQEKTLDVSQIDSRPSPSKQQKTLDGLLKRCSTSTEGQPSTKHPRF